MHRFAQYAFAIVTSLLLASTVLQIYLAGVGVFGHQGQESFAAHAMNGRVALPLLVLLSILFAALARAGRRTIWLTVLALGLLAMQTLIFVITGLIFNVGPDTPNPPIGAVLMASLHPLNGLILMGVADALMRRGWRAVRAGTTADAAAPAVDTATV